MSTPTVSTGSSPSPVELRSPVANEMRSRSDLPAQLEALYTLGRHAAGGLHAEAENSRVEDLARDAFQVSLAAHSATKQREFSASLRKALPEPVPLPTISQIQPVLDEVQGMRKCLTGLSELLHGGFDAQRSAIEASKVAVQADLDALRLATEKVASPPAIAGVAAQIVTFNQQTTVSFEALTAEVTHFSAATEAMLKAHQQQVDAREAAVAANFAASQGATASRLDRLEAAVGAIAAQVSLLAQSTQAASARCESAVAQLASLIAENHVSVSRSLDAQSNVISALTLNCRESLNSSASTETPQRLAGVEEQIRSVVAAIPNLTGELREQGKAIELLSTQLQVATAQRPSEERASQAMHQTLVALTKGSEAAIVQRIDALQTLVRTQGAEAMASASESTATLKAELSAESAAREAKVLALTALLPSQVAEAVLPPLQDSGAAAADALRSSVCSEVSRGTAAVQATLASSQAEVAHAIASGVTDAATAGLSQTVSALRSVREAVEEGVGTALATILEPLQAGIRTAVRDVVVPAATVIETAQASQDVLVNRIISSLPAAVLDAQRSLELPTSSQLAEAIREGREVAGTALSRIEASVARRIQEEGSARDASDAHLIAHVSAQLDRVHATLARLSESLDVGREFTTSSAVHVRSLASSTTLNVSVAAETVEFLTTEVAAMRSDLRQALQKQGLHEAGRTTDVTATETALQELHAELQRILCLLETATAGQAQIMAAAAAARATGLTADAVPSSTASAAALQDLTNGVDVLRRSVAELSSHHVEILHELRELRNQQLPHGSRHNSPASVSGSVATGWGGSTSILGSRRAGAGGSGLLTPQDALLSPHRLITTGGGAGPLIAPLLAATHLTPPADSGGSLARRLSAASGVDAAHL